MAKSNKSEKKDNSFTNPGANLYLKYSPKNSLVPQNANAEEMKKEMGKTKKEFEKIKNVILKKYPFTVSLGILPPQSIKFFLEEEEVPKETEKFTQIYMIIPEENFKEIPKIKPEIVKELEKLKQKVWIQIKTPVDVWDNCLDGKFELTEAIAMSFPIYDKGFLSSLRISQIHKSLVLQKFEKYVVSYVIAGSLVRGEAKETSDIDIFVVINDTDVKRMPRLELKERLRSIIVGQHVQEANLLSGSKKNLLNIQVYLLTEFWEAVKDAHPVMFTFIRDGVPLYDRGTFMPWKALLKMGKLRPSPESIDMFMKTAERTGEMAERRLIDAMIDLYYGVLNPSQALLMLYGLPPPTPKETPSLMEKTFVTKEKMLTKKDLEVLNQGVDYFKNYEHDPKMKIKGVEIDKLVVGTNKYLKKLKELRKDIEKRTSERTIEKLYEDIIGLLKTITKEKSQKAIVERFEKEFVKKGKFAKSHITILKDVIRARSDFKKGKLNAHKIDNARKNASILINDLVEFSQRCDLAILDKSRMKIKIEKGILEIVNADEKTFLISGMDVKIIGDKITKSSMDELNEAISKQTAEKTVSIKPKVFEVLKKEFGDFEIIL